MAHEEEPTTQKSGLSTTLKVVCSLLGGVALLVIVASICLPWFVVLGTKDLPARGRRTQALADMRQIRVVAETMKIQTDRWPEAVAEMVGDKGSDGKLRPVSLEKFPRDPWANPYHYEISNGQARVTCLGSDGAVGGEGEAADITLPEGGR